jgi:uncharacterized protein involved in exopolysaccharide biosynthesis
MTSEIKNMARDDGFDVYEFSRTLWQGRWLFLLITLACTIFGVAYALLTTEWFRADVLMVQVEDSKSLSGSLSQLGGLASLAGININGSGQSQEPVAVLKSRELVREFILDKKLTKTLLADKLDAKTGEWKVRDPADQPDIRDAVDYFEKKVCKIVEDKKAGLVTLSVTWKDPQVAAEWANELAQRVNAKLRDKAIREAERNIAYLKDEMAASNITSMQQSIGRVLESQMQKLLLARGNDEFAFKVVDPAVGPRKPTWPQRPLIIGGSIVLGILISIVAIIVRQEIRARRASEMAGDEIPKLRNNRAA